MIQTGTPIPPSDDERERRIRERAYQLWQSEGSPTGREEEYWYRALEMIEAEAQTDFVSAHSVQIEQDLIMPVGRVRTPGDLMEEGHERVYISRNKCTRTGNYHLASLIVRH